MKSQEETQQWDWCLEPAVSLSKSDEKKANLQVFIVWSLFSESVFPETTLLISLVTSFSLFPFISFVFLPSLLFNFFFLSFYFYSLFQFTLCLSTSLFHSHKTNRTCLTSACFPVYLENTSFVDHLEHDNFITSSICVKRREHQWRKKNHRKIMLKRNKFLVI